MIKIYIVSYINLLKTAVITVYSDTNLIKFRSIYERKPIHISDFPSFSPR